MELYKKGIKSIEHLRNNEDLLNLSQIIGLKYAEEFAKRIPCEKVTRMFEFVKNIIEEMSPVKNLYRVEVCGSYRRGKETCGDMDIILTRIDGTFDKKFLVNLICELESKKFLTDHLSLPKHFE